MSTLAQRLREGMELRQLKQVDIIEKTGINKGALSSYISGKYEPKQNNIYLLAKALNVNEAWLMGHDVPMEKDRFNISTVIEDTPFNRALTKLESNESLTAEERQALKDELPKIRKSIPEAFEKISRCFDDVFEKKLLSYYTCLNSDGKIEALKRIEELTYIPRYKNETNVALNAAHVDKNATEEEKQHDDDIMDNDEFWK